MHYSIINYVLLRLGHEESKFLMVLMLLYLLFLSILLQNATNVYYKVRQFYYKMRSLLQNASV